MGQDSFIQVSPDVPTGKQVDMEQTSTAAGATIYRERVHIVGDAEESIVQMYALQQQMLSVLRAILVTLNALSNLQVTEEDVQPPIN